MLPILRRSAPKGWADHSGSPKKNSRPEKTVDPAQIRCIYMFMICLCTNFYSLEGLHILTVDREILKSARGKDTGRSCACHNPRTAASAATRLHDEILNPREINSTQYSGLMDAQSRGPLPSTWMAKITVAERTSLTRNLTLLEKKGSILIAPVKDRWELQVSLTEPGQESPKETKSL